MIKYLVLALFQISAMEFATASTETSEKVINVPSFDAGHLTVSINALGVGYATGDVGFVAGISPSVEYFVWDRLALGGTANISRIFKSETTLNGGPSVSYHFWDDGRFSAYAGAAYLFGVNSTIAQTLPPGLSLYVGGNYNFASWFGLGPRVAFNHNFSKSDDNDNLKLLLVNVYFYF